MKKIFTTTTSLFFLFAIAGLAISNSLKSSQDVEVKLTDVSPFSYCCVTHKGPFTEIENVIGKLMQAAQSQNLFPAGAIIGIYYNSPDEVKPEELEWEIGFPVSAQANVLKPLEKKQWKYSPVAAAIHKGAYEETGQTISKILEWMQANGYVQAGPVMEKYLTMPTPDTRPEDMRSEIWVPCKKK